MPIKVLHFVENWLPQTATWLHNHVEQLPADVENFVVCQGTQNLDQFPVSNLSTLGSLPKAQRFLNRIWSRAQGRDSRQSHLSLLEQVIRTVRPDILHSHFGHFGWINSTLARNYGIRHVVSFYGADLGFLPRVEPVWLSRYRQMSDAVDLVLCEGPHMARCIAGLGIDPARILIFRLGIDLNKLPFRVRAKPHMEPIGFLIAGSFREKKGIPYALEALELFHRDYGNIKLTILGDAGGDEREQKEKRKILDAVERSRMRTKMQLLGYRPHSSLIEQYYRNHIFVSPSVTSSDGDTEGGAPVTIIEAAAAGMLVATTHHCDIPFVLSEQNGNYIVPERDPAALARSIQSLVRLDDWSGISQANRQLIEEELDVRKQTEKLRDIYYDLAFSSRSAITANNIPAKVGFGHQANAALPR